MTNLLTKNVLVLLVSSLQANDDTTLRTTAESVLDSLKSVLVKEDATAAVQLSVLDHLLKASGQPAFDKTTGIVLAIIVQKVHLTPILSNLLALFFWFKERASSLTSRFASRRKQFSVLLKSIASLCAKAVEPKTRLPSSNISLSILWYVCISTYKSTKKLFEIGL